MPATIPLADIRAAIRERADMPLGDSGGVPRELVGDVEMNRLINASFRALHDLIIHAFGEDYFEAQATLTTLSTTDRLPLPHDFYKLLGLEMQTGGGYPGQWVTLHRVMRGDRNRYNWPNSFPLTNGLGRAIIGHSLHGSDIRIVPPPSGGIVLRMDYVPLTPVLADSGTIIWNATDGDILTINGSEVSGGLDWSGAKSTLEALGYDVSGSEDDLSLIITPSSPDQKIVWKTSNASRIKLTPSQPCWMSYADEYNGWLEYVIVDGARKCKAKEESDISVEQMELASLTERIMNAAADRDLGEPGTPTDVQTEGWGPGGSSWGF